MGAVTRELFASRAAGTSTATVDLGAPTVFVAWGDVTWIDSLSDFDRDNAVAIDKFAGHVEDIARRRAGYGGRGEVRVRICLSGGATTKIK